MIDDISTALSLDPARKRALLAKLLRARPFPLSFAQRRLWFLDQIEPGAATYTVPMAFRLRGRLHIAALQRALNEIVRRHDVLRSVIRVDDGEPVMHPVDGFILAIDQSDVTPDAPLESLLALEIARGFNLAAAPPIRVLLARAAADDHVLLVTMHHIVTDGWSISIFKRELGALFNAYSAGLPSPLPALSCRFADFAREERERTNDEFITRGLHYWREQLRDARPYVAFTTRHDAVHSASTGATESLLIDSGTREALVRLSGTHGTTLFSTLLSLWYLVLYRYTGQCELTIGSAIANRPRTAFEDLIGFFVNTLPLRACLDGEAPFSTLLTQVHATTLEAFEHLEIPLERLIEELAPARIAGRTPFVDVMFVLQNSPSEALTLRGLDVTTERVACATAKFGLALEVVESKMGLALEIVYRTDVFASVQIRAMLDAFANLAVAVVREPNSSAGELPILSAAGRERQTVNGRGTSRPLSGGGIDALFERRAECLPERIAVVCGHESLSYQTLNERANRLARHLRSIGVQHGSAVGIALERSPAMIVGLLAILKAGGVYLPLDPEYPRERLALMVEDAAVAVVLTERRHAARLEGIGSVRVAIDEARSWSSAPASNLGIAKSGADPAYIMYTSGSTGRPKGVMIPHRGIERLVIDPGYISIGRDDAVAQASTLAFDASTFEIWSALLSGARLVIVPKSVLLAPDALATCIAASGISVMFLTTALFAEIVRKAPATFRELRVLLVGGEKLDNESVELLCQKEPPAALINVYGPTEATTFSTAFSVDLGACVPADIPIGRPIANTEVFVLDDHRQMLPFGACGQLYIGGVGLALGYLGSPELTATKFIRHPLRDEPGARLYATGDLVRYDRDGNLEYLGRIDGQIKRRGFRIEPGEIETAVRACRGVLDAALVPRTDAAGNVRLVAYVTAQRPDAIISETIMTELRAHLPTHLLPDAIVALNVFPLTRSGKLDREALPAAPPRTIGTSVSVPVTDDLQQQLVRLWETLLGVHPIGIRDNFFALGGHSLLAVRLIGEIDRQFRARLPLAILFEQPTIEQLADALRSNPANLDRSPVVALNPAGTAPPLFYLHGSLMGGGYYCLALAEHLGPERPLFVMRPHGVDGGTIPPTIEAVATACIDELKIVRPEGPYLLGGYCSGGLVAFEMARQLRARGDRVDNVVLIDTPNAGSRLGASVDLIERCGRYLAISPTRRSLLCSALSRLTHRLVRFRSSSEKHAIVWRRLRKVCASLDSSRIDLTLQTRVAADNRSDILNAWRWLGDGYVPLRYAGRLTVLLSDQEREGASVCIKAWAAVAKRVDIRYIPGNHHSCITDHIGVTAKQVADALAS